MNKSPLSSVKVAVIVCQCRPYPVAMSPLSRGDQILKPLPPLDYSDYSRPKDLNDLN